MANEEKKNTFKSQWKLNIKTSKPAEARENASDRVVIGFTLTSDWLSWQCEFSGPITERSRAKLMKYWITFDSQ